MSLLEFLFIFGALEKLLKDDSGENKGKMLTKLSSQTSTKKKKKIENSTD